MTKLEIKIVDVRDFLKWLPDIEEIKIHDMFLSGFWMIDEKKGEFNAPLTYLTVCSYQWGWWSFIEQINF